MNHTCSTLWREWRTDEEMLGLGLGEESPEKSSEISWQNEWELRIRVKLD